MTDFGSSPHSHDSSDDIIEAEIVSNPTDPQSPAQSRRVVWFVMGLASLFFFLLLMVAGVAVWLMVRGGEGDRQAVVVAPPGVRIGTKWDHVKEAYANSHCDVDPETRGRIEQSIQRIFKIAGNGDLDATLRHVDCDAFMERLAETGTCDPNWADRIVIRSSFADVTSGPQAFAQFRTSSIDVIDDDKIIVYMYAWDAEDEIFEVRWWMTRSGNQWKVYDWESLLYGVSEADEYAVLLERQETTGVQNVYKAHEYYLEGAAALEAGKQEEGVKKLERAQALRVDPDLRNKMTLQNAFWLSSYGETEKAKKLFASIGKPEDCPGAWYGLAICAGEEGDYQQVIHYADLFIDRLGASPDALDLKVEALVSMGRSDAAVILLKDNLKLFPDRSMVMRRIFYMTPVEQRSELLPLLDQLDDPVTEAILMAGQAMEIADWPFLESLMQYASSPDASETQKMELEAIRLKSRSELFKAAGLLQKAYAAADNKAEKERLLQRFLAITARMDQPMRGYQSTDAKAAAFEFFQQAYDYGDYDLSPEPMMKLAEEHRLDFPEEPMLAYLEGSIHSETDNHDSAVAAYELGLRISKRRGDEASAELYQSRLDTERVYVMSPVEAFKASSNRASTFDFAAGRLDRQWASQTGGAKDPQAKKATAQLKQLIALHAADPEPSTYLPYYRAIAQWQSGDRDKAIGSLADIVFATEQTNRFFNESRQLARWIHEDQSWTEFLPLQLTEYQERLKKTEANENGEDSETQSSSDKIVEAYAIGDLFERLSELLVEEGLVDEVFQLAEIHRMGHLPEFDRKIWLLQAHFLNKEYQAVIDLGRSIPDSQWMEADYSQSGVAREKVFESMMRLGQHDQAISWAEKEVGTLSRDIAQLAIAYFAKRDLAALSKTLDEMVQQYWEYNQFAGHPLSADFLRDKEFRDLRLKYPLEIHLPIDESNVYYCFRERPDIATIQTMLRDQWSDDLQFKPIVARNRRWQSAFVANDGDEIIVLNFVSRPLETYGEKRDDVSALPFVVVVSTSQSEGARSAFERLNDAMRKAGCRVFYRDNESELVWLETSTDALGKKTTTMRVEQSVYAYLSEPESTVPNWMQKSWACGLVDQVSATETSTSSPKWEVMVEFTRGTAVEPVWMTVQGRPSSESTAALTAIRTGPVALYPDLQAGEPHAIRLEQIVQRRKSRKK